MPERTRVTAATGALAVLALAIGAAPATAAGRAVTPSPPAASASAAPRPLCATQISYLLAGHQTAPRPVPPSTSPVGGPALAGGGVRLPAGVPAPPPPRAAAWLVADAGSGQILAACNAHSPLAPASTLKVLSALALLPHLPADQVVTASAADASVDGTRVGMVPGFRYTVDDLTHGMLMSSGNDAATGLGEAVGGTVQATRLMTQTAAQLGALDTHVRNTSGLDEPGQVSSAYDLALLGRAALNDDRIRPVLTTRSYAFPEPAHATATAGAPPGAAAAMRAQPSAPRVSAPPAVTSYEIQNHNRLLEHYPGALGVKNGWTTTSGGSFIGAAERGGRRYVVSLLAGEDDCWKSAVQLLDWAFAVGPRATPVGRLVTGPEAAEQARAAGRGQSVQGDGTTGTSPADGAGSASAMGFADEAGRVGPVPAGFVVGGLLAGAAAAAVAAVRSARRAPRSPWERRARS